MSRFPLMPALPDGLAPTDRWSVTFGRKYNVCPRDAYLYSLHRRTPVSNGAMERGSAFHDIVFRATQTAIAADEPLIPPELVKAIADEVLADPAFAVPFEQHDFIRESSYRWALEQVIEPAAVVALEQLFVLEVDGVQVRGKLDRGTLLEGGAVLEVEDYKTSRAMPTYEDIGRRRDDGTVAAKDFQLVLYALLAAFGRPVRVEVCACVGLPPLEYGLRQCHICWGKEFVEIVEPFGIADRVQRFDLTYVFPGLIDRDGRMARRGVSLTRIELGEYMESLRAMVARVKHSVETGDWPAQYGSHCSECTARSECPIPQVLKDHAGTVNTREEAREAAERLRYDQDQLAAKRTELVRWVKAQPAEEKFLRYGRDLVIEVVYQEAREIKDKEGMFDAMQRAVDYGEPFDRSEWVKTKGGPRINDRRLTEIELEEERAV